MQSPRDETLRALLGNLYPAILPVISKSCRRNCCKFSVTLLFMPTDLSTLSRGLAMTSC